MKKTISKAMVMALIASLILVLAGCGGAKNTSPDNTDNNTASNTESVNSPNSEAKAYKIGMTMLSLAVPVFASIAKQAEETAKELGSTLTVVDAQNNPINQVNAIENFITSGVDAIIINPVDLQATAPTIKKAMEQGIKIIAYGVEIPDYDSLLILENEVLGKKIGDQAGKWINEKLGGNAEVAILNYPTIPELVKREKGVVDAIKAAAPNAKIVATGAAATPAEGIKVMENILQAHPNIKVVAALGDGGALGAAEAVKAAGKDTAEFFIVGADASDEALAKIKEGSVLRATIDTEGHFHGKMLVEMALKSIKGEKLEKKVFVDLKPIDATNIDSFLQLIKYS